MRALSKDTKNKDSGAPSYFEVDEYHAHMNSEIYDLGNCPRSTAAHSTSGSCSNRASSGR